MGRRRTRHTNRDGHRQGETRLRSTASSRCLAGPHRRCRGASTAMPKGVAAGRARDAGLRRHPRGRRRCAALLRRGRRRYAQAAELYAKSSPLMRRDGELVKNALHQVVRDNADAVRLAGCELGLSPSARAGLRVEPPAVSGDIEDVLGRRLVYVWSGPRWVAGGTSSVSRRRQTSIATSSGTARCTASVTGQWATPHSTISRSWSVSLPSARRTATRRSAARPGWTGRCRDCRGRRTRCRP